MTEGGGKKDDPGFYGSYEKFTTTLRAWFIAYGIGFIVYLGSKDSAFSSVTDKKSILSVLFFLVLGIFLQVVGALLYKYCMRYFYYDDAGHVTRNEKHYKLLSSLSDNVWVELSFDFGTLLCFVWSTFLAAKLLVT